MRQSIIITLFLFVLPISVFSQGFNSSNGRNHPELDWQVAETEHFKIMYPAHLAGIEIEAAPIAEATYDAMSKNLGVEFPKKIRIYFSDEDEIANGFAVPLNDAFTDIWVDINGVVNWTGDVKWLRKVVAHELGHVFHFKATQVPMGLIANFFATPIERHWTEGFAQYATERWDTYRGEQWLRTAVLQDALNWQDGTSGSAGRLLYAKGNAQLRFFAEHYGDSTLAKLYAYREPFLFGLTEIHDFYDAFEEVTGDTFYEFEDRWKRHMNIYYNTLAGQLEHVDSLGAASVKLPTQFRNDAQYSNDTTYIAVLGIPSLRRPVRSIYVVKNDSTKKTIKVAEGAILAPIAWSRDDKFIAFARNHRGENSSIVPDLYIVGADGKGERRLTNSRRAISPTFSPDGNRVAFVANESGTANVFTLNLSTNEEKQITFFEGDTQLNWVNWHPTRNLLTFGRFNPDGQRDISMVNLDSGKVERVLDTTWDDRKPIWSPDGSAFAYTSFRDLVPNVFILNLDDETKSGRVTHLMTGATVWDWLPADSANATGRLLILTHDNKRKDPVWLIDAGRRTEERNPTVPVQYTTWMTHTPTNQIPYKIEPDASLITKRYKYNSFSNISHGVTLAIPYVSNNNFGLFATTTWLDPLGKHTLSVSAGATVTDFKDESFFIASYINNQLKPTISFSGARLPLSASIYGDRLLFENITTGSIGMFWPLDIFDVPYLSTTLTGIASYEMSEPINIDDFPTDIPPPVDAQQTKFVLGFTIKKQRPWRHNDVHPLDGTGLNVQFTQTAKVLGADTQFSRLDVKSYTVLPVLGPFRLFLQGRMQAQWGESINQDYLGLSRYDNINLGIIPSQAPVALGSNERVRGFRKFVFGDRVAFGSAELRFPLLPSLGTQVLGGLLDLGYTSLAIFADAGSVWEDGLSGDQTTQFGVGVELKNRITLMGIPFLHSIGIAQPADAIGIDNDYEIYYRIHAALPF